MINRIIDSFVLELPDTLIWKGYEHFYKVEHQFDIFQDGKIRFTVHNHKDWEHRWGDYDQYEVYTFSYIDYYWYNNIEELIKDFSLNDKYEGRISNILYDSTIYGLKQIDKRYTVWTDETKLKVLIQINNLINQIKEHYNQIMNENIYT